ncbi:sortase, marine proteobacterial type [Solemya pervernicosa gill symbiont]|uniref:Sortase, marine proteobacterial type n=2 Tax=Gammaproteobacteria incertae sedis TaxID=118884 RepID=A0A1T2L1Z2_9GAMM|nr:class GN sortase [Candidatus Reidiella endopervernicosa]OOZ39092.1 sortase, marine proteobacterial type [Solemya pervernicosa gill symbiont]QKQ27184.1 class GN sortase [Candidatus Reidiella endopervernicosa]
MELIRRRLLALLLLIVSVAGGWQFGQGVWIYAKAGLAQVLMERAWQQSLEQGGNVKPWPWADIWPVARLRVERLGVDLIVMRGQSGEALAFGPGHNRDSAQPGNNGTVVVSGHRDTHFRFMQLLQAGDAIELESREGRFRYRLEEGAVVDARQTQIANREEGHYLALVTCYPFNSLDSSGSLRYLVSGTREVAEWF